MLAGKYPSADFAELRPRLVWDRDAGTLTGRPGAQRLAVTSGGTIPDRGLFGVFMVGEKATRVGELDEEMAVSYTHLRAHETVLDLVCRLLLEKKIKSEIAHRYPHRSLTTPHTQPSRSHDSAMGYRSLL